MKTFLNVWWHITLGFMTALMYAVLGLFYCCTIILIPVGLGWLQFAKFLLAPHTHAMVSKSDLALVTGKTQGTAAKTYSLIIRILYFPFGLVACLSAVGLTVGYCITIIGIPSGLVWARSIGTIFNPVNKVCVPRTVADEIARIKSGNASPAMQASGTSAPDVARVGKTPSAKTVMGYNTGRLEEITASPEMYKPELVEAAGHELEVRQKAGNLKDKVAGFDDGKIMEIITGQDTYAEELVYACIAERSRRDTEREIRIKEEQEAARIKAEQEEEAKMLHRLEVWKRVRPYVFGGASVAVIAGLVIYFTSDAYQCKRGGRLWDKGQYDKAAAVMSKVKNTGFRRYPVAKYVLYQYNLDYKKDTAAAAEALKSAIEDYTGKFHFSVIVRQYAGHLEKGDLQPYILQNVVKAATVMYENSFLTEDKLMSGALFYKAHLYFDARKVFEEYPDHKVSNGYIGMMHLYGQGGFEQDFDEAYRNILSAPDELPFLVHKGDLILYLKRSGSPHTILSKTNITDIDLIRNANRYYKMAADAAPDVEEYRIRKEVTDAVLEAYEKTPSAFRTDNSSRFWTTYHFGRYSDGAYYGVASNSGAPSYSTYPNGWGVFSWKSDNSFTMTRYSGHRETNSPGIYITSDYTVGVGKIDNDWHLSEGIITTPDGVRTEVNGR